MSVEHVLKNINILLCKSLSPVSQCFFLNSLKLDISFIVPASTPRRNDLVVKTRSFLRGPTKDRKGLMPPKRTQKNIRAQKRTCICHYILLKCMLKIYMIEIFIY